MGTADDYGGSVTSNGSSWAANAVAEDPAAALAAVQEWLPVRLIATARSAFKTCHPDEELSVVVARNSANDFDYLPVVEGSDDRDQAKERIIGLVELVGLPDGHAELHGFIRDRMRPLSEENLIGADASILTFLRDADRKRCRLIVSGPEISGLVSLSDLQRLPVRAALFAMVTHLEITMAHAIRSEFNQSEDWMKRLSECRQSKVRKKVAEAKSQDTFVDTLLFTEFCDKMTIIRKSPDFRWSKTAFESDLSQVQFLRDNLAHANDYAPTRDAAIQVCEVVRSMDQWIEWLAAWPTARSGSVVHGGN